MRSGAPQRGRHALTAQPQPTQTRQPSRLLADRTTVIGIGSLIGALLILIALITLITLLPAQTISQTMSTQASEREKLLGASLSRQMENYFSNMALDVVGLANRSDVRSTDKSMRASALSALDSLGKLRQGQIKAIVRVSDNGLPLYAWPDDWNRKIEAGQPLPWSISQNLIDQIAQKHGVQFTQQRQVDGGAAFLLIAPTAEGADPDEIVALQLDLDNYFGSNLRSLTLSANSQMWAFDRFGNMLFQYQAQPAFRGDINQIRSQARGQTEPTLLTDYPSPGQETVVAPVYAAFGENQSTDIAVTLVISYATAEGQQAITNTLQSLFLFGMAIIGFIILLGILVGRFLLRESGRRRQEEQRRSTARALLEMSRALNSSLDLNVVLQRILRELAGILPHDSASIMLVNPEERTVTIAAEAGTSVSSSDGGPLTLPLNQMRGAREVIMTSKPTLINDCLTDPRWSTTQGPLIRAWLGVPLRVRDEPVGVLNINSHTRDRFQPDDIDLAEAFADQAGVAIQNARAHEFQIKAYEVELETARAIQTSLLPQENPPVPQLELSARAIPALHVSGDYYQYYLLPDGRLGIAIGDVSGKGIPAALLMAVITTALRDEILRTPAPATLLDELNIRLLPRMQQNHMTSALLMSVFDPATRHVEIANGGMVQPYVYDGSTWSFVPVGGYPLGASARATYSAKTVTLAPESMLLFVSDGVIECQNLKQEFYGFERLEALLAEMPMPTSADCVVDTVLAAVRQHLEGQEPQDDITVVAVKSVEL
jgi:serine phosphatase RsbU (regulator of sigma subunit)